MCACVYIYICVCVCVSVSVCVLVYVTRRIQKIVVIDKVLAKLQKYRAPTEYQNQ